MNNPVSLPYQLACHPEALEGLQPGLLASFIQASQEYLEATGQRITVTSGKRTLHRMAELMAAFTIKQLEGMYCRHGYPQYILAIKTAREHGNVDAEQTYRILQQRTEGYISMHLAGGAIDVASDGLTSPALLMECLQRHGFATLDETELGVHCIHASYKQAEKLIIRE